jgi:hypothetical protein
VEQVVFTIARDAESARKALGLGRSFRLIGDLTRRVIVTNLTDLPWLRCFHEVRALSSDDIVCVEAERFLASGSGSVLYVEPGALAFGRLDAVFEACRDASRAGVEGRFVCVRVPECKTNGGVSIESLDDRLYAAPTEPVRLQLNVRTNTCRFIASGLRPRFVEPRVISLPATARGTYERALRALEDFEQYEQAHGFGYLRPTLKLRRSLDRRILRILGKR